MKLDYIPLANVPTAESLGASAKVLVVDGGEIKKTAKANVGEHPSGKLTITGTSEVNCASYATAQVVDSNLTAENIKKDVVILGTTGSYEGGSSDFTTAEVTVTLTNAEVGFYGVCLFNDGGDAFLSTACEMDGSGTLMAVLYGENPTIFECDFPEGASVAVTGDVTYADGALSVSGDGSIAITSGK